MARLLPSDSGDDDPESAPRVVGLDGDEADDLIGALSSGTARDILAALHEEPAAPSEVADRVDTTLQNAQYHLGNLRDADLVEVTDTVYSEKGREMEVYAPADRPLVLFAGRESDSAGLKAALKRLLGAVGALALASLLAQRLFTPGGLLEGVGLGGTGGADGEGAGGDGDAGAADAEPTPTPTPEDDAAMATEAADAAADGAGAALSTLPPGLVFFLGGLTVLLVLAAAWYVGRR